MLPVVIALGLAISVVSITALNAVSQNSQTLNAQYYSEIANEAAQARKRDFINATRSLVTKAQPSLPHLIMPTHHDVRAGDVNIRRLHATLTAVADAGPRDFAELLLTPGIGARTVRSLAMVAEIVHGAPYRFADPARFSLAHGGKDRHPFPVPLTVYDQTIRVLKTAVAKARLGREEELAALRRLDDQARRLEGRVTGPTFAQVLDQERLASHANGGRSVFGWEPPLKRTASG